MSLALLTDADLDAVTGGNGHGHGHGHGPTSINVSVIAASTFTIGNTTASGTASEAEGGVGGNVVIGAGNVVLS